MDIHSNPIALHHGYWSTIVAPGEGTGESAENVAIEANQQPSFGTSPAADAVDGDNAEQPTETKASKEAEPAVDLSEQERKLVEELKARDVEVRTHEQAHMAAGGQYVRGAPSYDLQIGPDGRAYAVGGEVNIDTSEIPGNPEHTLEKARTIQRAALAPAEPSTQDYRVAAAAKAMEIVAQREIAEQQNAEQDQQEREGDAGQGEDNASITANRQQNDIQTTTGHRPSDSIDRRSKATSDHDIGLRSISSLAQKTRSELKRHMLISSEIQSTFNQVA